MNDEEREMIECDREAWIAENLCPRDQWGVGQVLAAMRAEAESWGARVAELERLGDAMAEPRKTYTRDGLKIQCPYCGITWWSDRDEPDHESGCAAWAWRAARKEAGRG